MEISQAARNINPSAESLVKVVGRTESGIDDRYLGSIVVGGAY